MIVFITLTARQGLTIRSAKKLKTVRVDYFEDGRLRLDKLRELLEKDRGFRRGYRGYMEQELVGMSHSNENHNLARGDPAPISPDIIKKAHLTEKELALVFNEAVQPSNKEDWVVLAAICLVLAPVFFCAGPSAPSSGMLLYWAGLVLTEKAACATFRYLDSEPKRAKRIEETVWKYHNARNGNSDPNNPLRTPDNDWAKGSPV